LQEGVGRRDCAGRKAGREEGTSGRRGWLGGGAKWEEGLGGKRSWVGRGAGWEEWLGGRKGWAIKGGIGAQYKRGCVGGEAWRSERLGGRMKLDEKRGCVGKAVQEKAQPEEIKQPPPLEGITLYTYDV
jgi:hypothetical protein